MCTFKLYAFDNTLKQTGQETGSSVLRIVERPLLRSLSQATLRAHSRSPRLRRRRTFFLSSTGLSPLSPSVPPPPPSSCWPRLVRKYSLPSLCSLPLRFESSQRSRWSSESLPSLPSSNQSSPILTNKGQLKVYLINQLVNLLWNLCKLMTFCNNISMDFVFLPLYQF